MDKTAAAGIAIVAVAAVGGAAAVVLMKQKGGGGGGGQLASLGLNVSPTSVDANQDVSATVSAYDADNQPLEGVVAQLKLVRGGTLNESFPKTDTTGVAGLVLTFSAAGTYELVALSGGVTSSPVLISVSSTTGGGGGGAPTLQIKQSNVQVGGVVTWSGGNFTPDGTVNLMVAFPGGSVSLVSVKADGSGNASGTFNASSQMVGSDTLTVVDIASGQKAAAGFTVQAAAPALASISINASATSIDADQQVTFTGTAKDNSGNVVAGLDLYLYEGSSVADHTTTDSGGNYTFNETFATPGTFSVAVSDKASGGP